MATFPDYLRLDAEDSAELSGIVANAKARLERLRKTNTAKGKDTPLAPYEGSWAHEEEFRKSKSTKYACPKDSKYNNWPPGSVLVRSY